MPGLMDLPVADGNLIDTHVGDLCMGMRQADTGGNMKIYYTGEKTLFISPNFLPDHYSSRQAFFSVARKKNNFIFDASNNILTINDARFWRDADVTPLIVRAEDVRRANNESRRKRETHAASPDIDAIHKKIEHLQGLLREAYAELGEAYKKQKV